MDSAGNCGCHSGFGGIFSVIAAGAKPVVVQVRNAVGRDFRADCHVLSFLTTFVPFGLVIRLIGKDLLSTKIDKEKESYWVERTEQPGSMRQQF